MPPETGHAAFLRELPQDWQIAQIAAVAKVVGGGTPSRDVPGFWGGDIPWVTPGEVSAEVSAYLSETRERITAVGLAGSGATLLPIGSLMITTRATLGSRAINAVPMTTNQGFKSLVFERGTDAPFYYYLTDKLRPELKRRASGTTFLEVSGAELAKIEVPVPPVRERHLIAEVLDTLDTTIRQTEAIIDKLKQVKQGLLHDLLTRGIDANGELRPPQSEAPHLYKDSPLGWIPREWEVRPLATCTAKIADRDHTTPVYLHDGVLMISPVNLYDEEGIDFGNAKRISLRAHLVNRKKTDLQAGDLIIHRIGAGLGRVRLVTNRMPPFSILHSMAQIRPSPPTMSAEFMRWALRDNRVQLQIELGTQSIGVPDLGLDKIGGLLVVVPSLVEQASIASVLATHQCTVEGSRAELNKLRTLKSGLMDDLLTGRVRVTPLVEAAHA